MSLQIKGSLVFRIGIRFPRFLYCIECTTRVFAVENKVQNNLVCVVKLKRFCKYEGVIRSVDKSTFVKICFNVFLQDPFYMKIDVAWSCVVPTKWVKKCTRFVFYCMQFHSLYSDHYTLDKLLRQHPRWNFWVPKISYDVEPALTEVSSNILLLQFHDALFNQQ